MADSLVNIDKRLLFRETFESEQSVRRNGLFSYFNTPINNGIAILDGSSYYLIFNKHTYGIWSIRFKFKSYTPLISKYLFDARSRVTSYFVTGTATTLSNVNTGGTIYVDGLLTSTVSNNTKEIILSGANIDLYGSYFSRFNAASSGYLTGELESIEIYSGTLTAQEVSALYNNKRYREVSGHSEQLGAIKNISTCVNSSGNPYTSFTSASSTGFTASSNGTGAQICGTADEIIVTTNTRYRIKFDLSLTSGALPGGVRFVTDFGSTLRSDITQVPVSGSNSFILVANANDTVRLQFFHSGSAGAYIISNLSIQEILVESTKPILDVCACSGVARNKYSGDVYGSELVTDQSFTNSALWTLGRWTISNGIATVTSGASSTINLTTAPNVLVVGKTYRVTLKVNELNASYLRVYIDIATYQNVFAVGVISFDITCTNAGEYFAVTATGPTGNNSISYFSIKELIPSVTPTAITYRKENDVIAMEFNGSTSKIDCGSYDGLVGDKTFVAWVNIKKVVSGNSQDILNNGRLILRYFNYRVYLYSAAGSFALTASNSILPNNYYLIVATRTSIGIGNIYINGVQSGTANTSTDTPVVGTTNLIIGATPSPSNVFNGLISSVRIYDGILTAEEISSIYTSEKSKYGL